MSDKWRCRICGVDQSPSGDCNCTLGAGAGPTPPKPSPIEQIRMLIYYVRRCEIRRGPYNSDDAEVIRLCLHCESSLAEIERLADGLA